MLALHFGAGNIGRGFIGQLLSASNYEVCFIDVNQSVIDDINSLKQYHIEIVGDVPERILIQNISALNSSDTEAITDNLLHADIITTALGPTALKFIAPVISAGLSKRISQDCPPINIIACENMQGASSILRELVCDHLSSKDLQQLSKYAGFPDAAVDRIVPLQKNSEKLLVQTERFFEWDVDETGIAGNKPPVNGITYVKNLQAYIERKLFAVNATHAAIAYLGYIQNINYINQAINNDNISSIVKCLLKEAGFLLNKKYDFSINEFNAYSQRILQRFSSKYIADDVTRVGRSPIRKLGVNDRLIAPAIQLADLGIISDGYSAAIAAAFCFDYKNDTEAVALQVHIKKNGLASALFHYSRINPQTELGKVILHKYNLLQK